MAQDSDSSTTNFSPYGNARIGLRSAGASGPAQVRAWQFGYVCIGLILYLAIFGIGTLMATNPDLFEETDPPSFQIAFVGGLYAGIGAVFAIMFAVGLFWRNGLGGWIYNLILIILGLTTCCTWPATIPILIFWIKDKDRIIG